MMYRSADVAGMQFDTICLLSCVDC